MLILNECIRIKLLGHINADHNTGNMEKGIICRILTRPFLFQYHPFTIFIHIINGFYIFMLIQYNEKKICQILFSYSTAGYIIFTSCTFNFISTLQIHSFYKPNKLYINEVSLTRYIYITCQKNKETSKQDQRLIKKEELIARLRER